MLLGRADPQVHQELPVLPVLQDPLDQVVQAGQLELREIPVLAVLVDPLVRQE